MHALYLQIVPNMQENFEFDQALLSVFSDLEIDVNDALDVIFKVEISC